MNGTVFLFDIDGTLVNTGGIGRRAMTLAFSRVTGRDDACERFRFDGMTDRAIARKGLRSVGHPDDDASIDRVLDAYLVSLEQELQAGPGYGPLPGVLECLEHLSQTENVALGLGTGNISRGAELKLAAADIWEPFDFGGFGCDHEDRRELIRIGASRGAARLGGALDDVQVVVIGDTPKDVDAARALGAFCIGVGTGRNSKETLLEAGADRAFDNLAYALSDQSLVIASGQFPFRKPVRLEK